MRIWQMILAGAGAGAAALGIASPAAAHCDGIDGPVVAAAQMALERGDPNLVLIWVQPMDEAEIRAAFAHAVKVRGLGPEARSLADRYFFETLVRVHRAGEGAAYTGLKPAGRDLGPAIPLADKAIASGSDRALTDYLARQTMAGVQAHFADLQKKRNFRAGDLAAGRDYVASYVTFIHYVEGLHAATQAAADGHYAEPGGASPAHDD